jgi:ABC-type methionine transport system ATPase subunit
MAERAMIELQQVSKSFGGRGQTVHALLPTDLTIAAGEVVGLLGFSGAGSRPLATDIATPRP